MIIYTLRVQRRCCGFQLWETLNSKGGIGVEDTRIVAWALKTVSGSEINIQLRTSDLDDSHWHGMVWRKISCATPYGARFQCGTKITAGIGNRKSFSVLDTYFLRKKPDMALEHNAKRTQKFRQPTKEVITKYSHVSSPLVAFNLEAR